MPDDTNCIDNPEGVLYIAITSASFLILHFDSSCFFLQFLAPSSIDPAIVPIFDPLFDLNFGPKCSSQLSSQFTGEGMLPK